jgi:hypothetical protein
MLRGTPTVNLNWILSPLTIYGVILMALIATLVMFVTAKLEIQQALNEARKARLSLDGALEEMSAGMGQLRSEMATTAVVAVSVPGPGLNLTRRTQALRMLRRGETPESIASALRTPRNEIELLVKLQQMTPGA